MYMIFTWFLVMQTTHGDMSDYAMSRKDCELAAHAYLHRADLLPFGVFKTKCVRVAPRYAYVTP